MAVDTKQKRASAHFQLIPGLFYVVPTGTVDSSERKAVTWVYSGITAVVAGGMRRAFLLRVY